MRDLEREGKVEVAIIETLILVNCVTDEIFGALERSDQAPSPLEIERILALQLILQRRAGELFEAYHGYKHGSVQS